VLSQLSYSPTYGTAAEMVGLGRVELPTSPLSGVRSNQLSYRPKLAGSPAEFYPDGSQILSFIAKGFRGHRLNMLGGYAAHDHYGIDQAKEGLYQDSRACRQERLLRGRWTRHSLRPDSRLASLQGYSPLSRKECYAISSLLERR
jgi:hypothetical protein